MKFLQDIVYMNTKQEVRPEILSATTFCLSLILMEEKLPDNYENLSFNLLNIISQLLQNQITGDLFENCLKTLTLCTILSENYFSIECLMNKGLFDLFCRSLPLIRQTERVFGYTLNALLKLYTICAKPDLLKKSLNEVIDFLQLIVSKRDIPQYENAKRLLDTINEEKEVA